VALSVGAARAVAPGGFSFSDIATAGNTAGLVDSVETQPTMHIDTQ